MSRTAMVVLALWLGCGPDDAGDDDDDSDVPPDASTDAAAPADAATDAAGQPVCEGTVIDEVSGTLVDPAGAGIPGATVGLCVRAQQRSFETFVCLRPVPTDGDGAWSTSVPENLHCVKRATVRLAAPGWATTYCEVDVEGAGPSVSAPEWALLPMPGDPPAWGGGDDEIVLAAADGSEVSIRPSDVDPAQDPDAVRLLAVDPTSARPCFVPEGQTLLSLIVLEPESNVVRAGGLPARLHDATGAAPGTPVSFYMLGGLHSLLDGVVVEEGTWVPFADAVVAEDGTITTPDGDGLPQLGWVGVAPR